MCKISKARKIDETWEKLNKKYKIVETINSIGYYKISADEIKEFQEPRLAVKFDHSDDRPKLFMEHDLSILPITRGDYYISRIKAYHNFESISSDITYLRPPEHIKSLDITSINSESKALNMAYISGIIADFLNDKKLLPTVSGRMSSEGFVFQAAVEDKKATISSVVQVENSQIEIDAAYEGINSLALMEAKRDLAENFLIRQLYYPFRTWQRKMGNKPVRPIFLIYSNSIFYLYEYRFNDLQHYNSLELVKHKRYSLEDTNISADDLQEVLDEVRFNPEPLIHFPQADSFERVINICELLYINDMEKDSITEEYSFDTRQSLYYLDAARYLGLVKKEITSDHRFYSLTKLGNSLFSMSYKERQAKLIETILSYKSFYLTYEAYRNNNEMPSKAEIVSYIRQAGVVDPKTGLPYSDSTNKRRASTVSAWVRWIINTINN
ncbi:transcriptional regulator [Veillonella sp. S13053-19]|uniref:type II restriction enzyme n=1 Tax=Veillonella sp. S13053-19 TaxID=2027456 RepID=UPI000CF3E969|nr:transcriptional regulator [Veillonella sp. S13053-19]PQL13416.1 transcriptional regulator [Veillonella sp. S13053-19]